jgi:serine/threonine-protein kinase
LLPGLGDEVNEPASVLPLKMLLSAATIGMLVGAAGFLFWGLSSGAGGVDEARLFLVVVILAASAAALFAIPDLTTIGLRRIERVVFGTMAAYLGWAAYRAFHALLAAGDTEGLGARWSLTLMQFVLLMVTYGALVPNAWPRAARVIGGLALVPVAVVAASAWSAANAAGDLGAVATPGRIAESLLVLLIAAALSVLIAYVSDQYLGLARSTRITLRYLLKRRIGQGGMGEVWLGEHNLLARPAAVKLIRADAVESRSPEKAAMILRRFEREAQATASLRSAHTVEVYDFGVSDDGMFYYAMEYLDGIDLSELVASHGPVPAPRVAYLLEQACQSLADAHEHGMTHRDIKPANIFACRLGTAHDFVKVLDFGLVTAGDLPEVAGATDLTLEGEISGTPAYMAPELVQNGAVADGRADIYALGCVAYYLLTGTPVFEGQPLAVLVDHVKTVPTPPSQRTDRLIPPQLEAVILKCLAKDPTDRYQSAAELADALADCCLEPAWTGRTAADWWQLHMPRSEAV